MRFCSVLDVNGMDTYKRQIIRVGFAVSRGTFFIQDRPGLEINMQYAPLVSTPQSRSFSEITWVKLGAEVVQVGGSASKFSNESKGFSWGLMAAVVELFIFSGFFILQPTLK
jgi:hypothetical protein